MFGAIFAINYICICLSFYVKELQDHTAQLVECLTEEPEVMSSKQGPPHACMKIYHEIFS